MLKYFAFFCINWFVLILPATELFAQGKNVPIYFLSDCQLPLYLEELILKPYKNKEGRDSLFKAIERERPGYVFMLGDIVGMSYDTKEWLTVDTFLNVLHSGGACVFSVPGNHEYLLNASLGIANYISRFPDQSLTGYCVRTDSMTIVMLNSNFRNLTESENNSQQLWYLSVMDSLDTDESVKAIIVCAHHSPYSNSKVVGSSTSVQYQFVKRFESSSKTKIFISGHSHNLEYFTGSNNKRYLVIGGGGGIAQPLNTGIDAKYNDLIKQEDKPLFFYVALQRNTDAIEISIRGYSKAMERISEIKISL